MAAERVQALAASGLWEAVNLPALREKPAEKPRAKPEGASTAVCLSTELHLSQLCRNSRTCNPGVTLPALLKIRSRVS